MSLFKKAASFLLALSLVLPVFVLTSCHGDRGLVPFEGTDAFDPDKTYEITFWAKNDTNKNQTGIYAQSIEDFEKIYPNIKVKIRLYADYGRIYNDVITNISTLTTPNVCITYPDHIATYITGNNVVVPLDSLFEDEKYGLGGSELKFDGPDRDEMIEKYLDECIIDSSHYAVPFMRSTEACYINVTLLEQMGYTLPDVLTWDFIWEVADKAGEQDEDGTFKVNGQKTMIPFLYKSTDNMMIQYLRQRGAGYSDPEGNIGIFNDVTKEFLYEIAEHTGKKAFSTFAISSYPANFLNAGQCVFAVDSTAGATWMGKKAPHSDIAEDAVVDYELAVRPIPQYDPERPVMISQGPSICIFNKRDGGEVVASWLFAQYLISNDVQLKYAETEGYIPVTKKAQESDEYKAYIDHPYDDTETYYSVKLDATKLLLGNIENTFVTPVFNGSASLRDAAGQMIEKTARSVRRKENVDDAYIENLFSDVSSLYRLDMVGANKVGFSPSDADLGPMPGMAKGLFILLGAIWCLMGIYVCYTAVRKKKRKKS